jgi:hypothetical protein
MLCETSARVACEINKGALTVDTKTENTIASLIAQRDKELDQTIIEWAGRNLSPVQANELIEIVRNSLSAINVKAELTTLATNLTRPAT